MRSTIKNLPATLPEPSSMDRGSRTGVTGAVSASELHVFKRVGRKARVVVRGSRTLINGLMDLLASDNIQPFKIS